MTTIKRKASVIWKGDLRSGNGMITTESQTLKEQPYNFGTRFEDKPGTNPEELIAAAHAACFSMALASTLKKRGYDPTSIITNAVCTMVSKPEGGFKIARMHLHVQGEVPEIDAATFKQVAEEADKGCPVSNLLRCGLQIDTQIELM